jgi:tetratricopeptide (TPR) repeat protein
MPGFPRLAVVVLAVLMTAVVGLQVVLAERAPAPIANASLLYIRSGGFLTRAALSYRSLLADIYWIRTVQHYGGTKRVQERVQDGTRRYDLLYPLLDLTTALDPQFDIVYRFGAIFLAEPFPGGAGRPDQAIALLEKGLAAQPGDWDLAQQIGFIHYWWRRDYTAAADWFNRASQMPDAPAWLSALAAVTLAEGGSFDGSRRLWQQVLNDGDAYWLHSQATFRLKQLDAMEAMAVLQQRVRSYAERTGGPPGSWNDLIRAGEVRGVPLDPEQHPFVLRPDGTIGLDPESPLNPLPPGAVPRA